MADADVLCVMLAVGTEAKTGKKQRSWTQFYVSFILYVS